MPGKPYDASLKDVVEGYPDDWARLLGDPSARNVRVIDADVSTITAAADKALLIASDEGDYVLHPELQSSYNSGLPKRTWWYNSVYHQRLNLPVVSVAVLLRPQADGPMMNGRYEIRAPRQTEPYHIFKYNVLRIWQVPVETLLTGGVGILPLAALADDAATQLPSVLRTIDRRLNAETRRDEADKLRTATTVLMGLRHSQDLIAHLLKGMWPMWNDVLEDSSVIQHLKQRAQQLGEEQGRKIGEERGVQIGEERASARFREALLRMGEKRFGPPDLQSRAIIENLTDPDRLAALSERVLDVKTWQELLA